MKRVDSDMKKTKIVTCREVGGRYKQLQFSLIGKYRRGKYYKRIPIRYIMKQINSGETHSNYLSRKAKAILGPT